jgi:hypothetical protein
MLEGSGEVGRGRFGRSVALFAGGTTALIGAAEGIVSNAVASVRPRDGDRVRCRVPRFTPNRGGTLGRQSGAHRPGLARA